MHGTIESPEPGVRRIIDSAPLVIGVPVIVIAGLLVELRVVHPNCVVCTSQRPVREFRSRQAHWTQRMLPERVPIVSDAYSPRPPPEGVVRASADVVSADPSKAS